MKRLQIGFSSPHLHIETDGTLVTLDQITKGSSYYIGYTGRRGKYAIYITVEDVSDRENYLDGTAVLHVLINNYETSEKFKEYTLTLRTEWHIFDELI